MSEPLTLTRTLPAAPDRVFRFLTTAAELMRWWGLPGSVLQEVRLDPQVGGRWRIHATMQDGTTSTAIGQYRLVEPPHRLVYDWAFERPEGATPASVVDITLQEVAGGTLLTLVHSGITPTEAMPLYDKGWGFSLGRLAEALALVEAA